MGIEKERKEKKEETTENSKITENTAIDMTNKSHNDIKSDVGCEHLLRARLEAMARELEMLKRQHEADMQEKDDQTDQSKRQYEKKLAELEDEKEDAERNLQQQKKKSQRLLGELNDSKIQLDEILSRNHELEKKQRQFDSQSFAAQA